MHICGIDPGLQTTGYGVLSVDNGVYRLVDAGTLKSNGQDVLAVRLGQIYTDLVEIIDEWKPNLIAVERLYSHYKHPQTAVLMGHVRGIILLAGESRNIAINEYTATEVKKSLTGNGRAGKVQMQRAIQVRFGLARPPQPADVADALALAVCSAARYGQRRPNQSTSKIRGVTRR